MSIKKDSAISLAYKLAYIMVALIGVGCFFTGCYMSVHMNNNLFLFPAMASGYMIRDAWLGYFNG